MKFQFKLKAVDSNPDLPTTIDHCKNYTQLYMATSQLLYYRHFMVHVYFTQHVYSFASLKLVSVNENMHA